MVFIIDNNAKGTIKYTRPELLLAGVEYKLHLPHVLLDKA